MTELSPMARPDGTLLGVLYGMEYVRETGSTDEFRSLSVILQDVPDLYPECTDDLRVLALKDLHTATIARTALLITDPEGFRRGMTNYGWSRDKADHTGKRPVTRTLLSDDFSYSKGGVRVDGTFSLTDSQKRTLGPLEALTVTLVGRFVQYDSALINYSIPVVDGGVDLIALRSRPDADRQRLADMLKDFSLSQA